MPTAVEHACVARGHDDWAMAVLGQIQMCSDLVAADSIYHLTCHTICNFAAVNPKLPRLTSWMTAKNLCSGHGIPIHVYSKMFGVGIDHLDLKSVHSLMQPVVLPPVVNMSS